MPPVSLAVASSALSEQLAMSPTATTTSPEGGRGGRSGAHPKARKIARASATKTTCEAVLMFAIINTFPAALVGQPTHVLNRRLRPGRPPPVLNSTFHTRLLITVLNKE